MTSEISKKMILHMEIVKSLAEEAERPLVKQNEVERNLCCGYESNTLQSSEHFGENMIVRRILLKESWIVLMKISSVGRFR